MTLTQASSFDSLDVTLLDALLVQVLDELLALHPVDERADVSTVAEEGAARQVHWTSCGGTGNGKNGKCTSLTNHPFVHTLTHRRRSQPCQATASSSGAATLRCLAQGHLDTQRGRAENRTSNLPVTSQPALPPKPPPPKANGSVNSPTQKWYNYVGIYTITSRQSKL